MNCQCPPTVDDQAPQRLQRAIGLLVRRFSISERADVACCGTTVAQAATLQTLLIEGPLRQGELSARLGISPSTLTRNLARLRERGLVLRQRDPRDARAWRLELSRTGERAAHDVDRIQREFAGRLLARIPQARRALTLRAIEELVAAVEHATRECCGEAFDHLIQLGAADVETSARKE